MDLKYKAIEEGILIGPNEDEAAVLKRNALLERTFACPPSSVDHFLTDPQRDEAVQKVHAAYGMKPERVVSFYSNLRLSLFQGGAMWIHEENEVRVPLIQLKTGFEKGRYFLLYRRDEALAHELVHAMRIAFDEPLFEEIFAYRTSRWGFRRFLGPIFQRPWEGYVFILTLVFPALVDFNLLSPIFSYLPLLAFGLLFGRLCFLRLILSLARRWLTKQIKKPENVWSMLLQLTDREILSFGLASDKTKKTLLKEKKDLRWKLMRKAYL